MRQKQSIWGAHRLSGRMRSIVCTAGLLLIAACAWGTDYYIDPAAGSDDNDGGKTAPWKSFRNVISYYKPDYRPAGWVELKGGDCIYLGDGVYSETFHPGEWEKGPTGGGVFVAYFRDLRSDAGRPFRIKVLPGQRAVIDPRGKGIGLSIFQSGNWEVEGIEVANAYGRGVSLDESKKVRLRKVHIHDTDGVDNNNISGLYITDCRDVMVYNCIFNDNYDRTCADTAGQATENSANVVIFGGMQGGDITIADCQVYQSLPLTDKLSGGGIKYKHASRAPEARFNVYRNLFRNCKFFAFGSGTANTHFHHNLIIGGAGISSRDFGGVTHQVSQVFEYNTIYNSTGFQVNPTIQWRNEKFPDDPRDIVFRNNIVIDAAETYSNERGIVTLGTYMPDDVYEIAARQLKFENNCYFNPRRAVQFNIAAGFNYKEEYRKGGAYSLREWQSEYGYDADSVEADPLFVDVDKGDFSLRADSPCRNVGRYGMPDGVPLSLGR